MASAPLRTAGVKTVNWPRDSKTNLHADAKADLRGVHWQIGYTDHGPAKTETKTSYVSYSHPDRGKLDPEAAKELRRSHIDLAAGEDKSSAGWKACMTDDMSKNAKDKFGCEKPAGFQALGAELRKSSVSFSDQPGAPTASEQKAMYGRPPPRQQVASFKDSIGNDLQASHVNLAHGVEKNTKEWYSSQNAEMGRCANQKFKCEKPQAFEALGKELRKSSVPLPHPRSR